MCGHRLPLPVIPAVIAHTDTVTTTATTHIAADCTSGGPL